MKLILTIELVPSTSWYNNVRSQVTPATWNVLKKGTAWKANNRCELCSETGLTQGYKWPVECHEIWEYDDKKHTQTLKGLISLCPNCHKVKHAGRTISVDNNAALVVRQLCKVNKMTELEAINYITESFKVFQKRSKFMWTVDTTWLNSVLKVPIKIAT